MWGKPKRPEPSRALIDFSSQGLYRWLQVALWSALHCSRIVEQHITDVYVVYTKIFLFALRNLKNLSCGLWPWAVSPRRCVPALSAKLAFQNAKPEEFCKLLCGWFFFCSNTSVKANVCKWRLAGIILDLLLLLLDCQVVLASLCLMSWQGA